MKRLVATTLALSLAVSLAACGKPDRQTADAKLADACVAAVKALYAPEDTLTVKEKTFANDKSQDGTPLRTAKLTAHYVRNGGIIEQKEYSCSFEEKGGMFAYQANFYRMTKDGMNYGNFNGSMEGDYGDLLKIQEATEGVLSK
jgi:hypothetical protein